VKPSLGDVPGDEFRAALHRAADWIADYRETIESRRIIPSIAPGDIASTLPAQAPEAPVPLAAILDDLDRLIMPGIVHWGHPAFLGYFGSTTTAPGILGEMIAAALNVSAMTWRTSPAATELETVVLDWMRTMMGLPAGFEGIVYDTASIATLHALAAAREAIGLDVRREGLAGRGEVPRLMIYASDQAHSSVDKAAIALGLGETSVRRVDTDAEYRMSPTALRAAIARDLRLRRRPLAVVATRRRECFRRGLPDAHATARPPVAAPRHRQRPHHRAPSRAHVGVATRGRLDTDGQSRLAPGPPPLAAER
jgi:aromatic-L-amino-acid decarboxylase